MVIITPWKQHQEILVKIDTISTLGEDEKREIENVIEKYPPYGPYPTVIEVVEEIKKTNPKLASKIIIP